MDGVRASSATHEAQQGMRVTCCGDVYILVYLHEGEWWGANLGPPDRDGTTGRTPKFMCKVPVPFLWEVVE